MTRSRPVAVVGLGIKAPGGCSVARFWSSLLDGTSAATTVPALCAAGAPVHIGCPVTDDDSTEARYWSRSELRRVDGFTRLGVAAAADALDGIDLDVVAPPERRGAAFGVGLGGLAVYDQQRAILTTKGFKRCSPFTVPMMMPNAAAAAASIRWHLGGPTITTANACAAATTAIGQAARAIAWGDADFMLAGGTEALLIEPVVAAFARMEALVEAADPSGASRPFDRDRAGFVLGEGAAMLALAERGLAEEAGLPVYGEVAGFAANSDAYHIAAPREDGTVAARCMTAALVDAGLDPVDIVHVNAHGTSTPRNDVAESRAIEAVFGRPGPPVTSTKGTTGHLLGASGAVEAVAALLAATTGLVPPVAGLRHLDEEVAVDVVVGAPREVGPGAALSNSFAFGGHNACLVLTPGPADPSALLELR